MHQYMKSPSARRPTSSRHAVLSLLGCILAVTGVAGCSESTEARRGNRSRAVAVESTNVQRQTVPLLKHYTGEVVGLQTRLIAEMSGEVRAVLVRIGDSVQAGDVLAELDPTTARNDLQMARAMHQSAQAKTSSAEAHLQAARLQVERNKPLRERSLISQQAWEDLNLARKTAEAEFAMAKAEHARTAAAMNQAEYLLQKTRIVAPYDGRIAAREIDPGNILGAGSHTFTLAGDSTLWVQFRIPEADLPVVAPGNPLQLKLDHAETSVTGTVRGIAGEVSPTNRLVLVEGKLYAPPGTLLPGQFGQVSVLVRNILDALVVPESAIVDRRDEEFVSHTGVYIAHGPEAAWVPVEILGTYEDIVAVAGQLESGQHVLTAGHQSLEPGASILDLAQASETTSATSTTP